jgi:hypothetical protein
LNSRPHGPEPCALPLRYTPVHLNNYPSPLLLWRILSLTFIYFTIKSHLMQWKSSAGVHFSCYYSEACTMLYAVCYSGPHPLCHCACTVRQSRFCRSERSEESYSGIKILHCVQDDRLLSASEFSRRGNLHHDKRNTDTTALT